MKRYVMVLCLFFAAIALALSAGSTAPTAVSNNIDEVRSLTDFKTIDQTTSMNIPAGTMAKCETDAATFNGGWSLTAFKDEVDLYVVVVIETKSADIKVLTTAYETPVATSRGGSLTAFMPQPNANLQGELSAMDAAACKHDQRGGPLAVFKCIGLSAAVLPFGYDLVSCA